MPVIVLPGLCAHSHADLCLGADVKTLGIRKRLYLSFLAAAVVPTLVAGTIGIYYSLATLRQQTLHHLHREVDTTARDITLYFDQVGSVLRYLANSSATHELIQGMASGEAARRDAAALLQRDWLNLAASYPHLKQVRFLDHTGHERVRVDNRMGELRVVDESLLQDKSSRYYFSQTMALASGRFYVSRLDLNEEYGHVEQPASPVIRLSTPVSDNAGRAAGMLIVNLDAQVMLRDLERMVEQRPAQAFLFDPDGHFLERGAEQASVALTRPLGDFARLHGADTLARILEGSGGTLQSRGWILAFSRVSLLPEISDRQRDWRIVLAYPEKEMFLAVFNLYLLYAVLAMALAVTAWGGYALSRRLLGPLEALASETEAITRGDYSRRIPVRGDDEIADLGHKFNRMVERLEHLMQSLAQHRDQLEATVQQRTAELEHQRGRLLAIIEHTAEAIVVTNDEGSVLLANVAAHAMLELSAGGAMTHDAAIAAVWPMITTESRLWREVRVDVLRAERVLAVSATRLRNPLPRPEDLILVMRDVSEERHLQDERRELDRQLFQMEKLATLGELVMGLAHEIGNPLAGMKAVVQAMRFEPVPADIEASLARLESEIDRLSTFLRSFHGFAAPQAIRIGPAIFSKALDDVLFWVRKEAQCKCIELQVTIAESLPLLAADPAQLKQALLNILVNAIAAMPDGGTLHISAQQADDGMMRIRIEDSGSGIPPALLKRVFEPFFTTRERGTGLGLAIVAKIIEHHGGRIQLNSELGRGTVVDLFWPILAVEVQHG